MGLVRSGSLAWTTLRGVRAKVCVLVSRRTCLSMAESRDQSQSCEDWRVAKGHYSMSPPERGNALVAYEIAVNDGKQKETNVRTITQSRIE